MDRPTFYISLILISLTVVSAENSSHAHPVAFQNSIGIMGHHTPTLTHHQINYSFKYWLASGIHYIRRTDSAQQAAFASTNVLLKRWNGQALQANIYALMGVGTHDFLGGHRMAGLSALQFDIEDRKYYFLSKHLEAFDQDQSQIRQSILRAGLAPYQGDFDDIHSWIILEWQRREIGSDVPVRDVTAFLRIFYNNLLFEVGQSFDGATKFNYISHF